MSQQIEPPNATDIDFIARSFLHANELVKGVTGEQLTGGETDLAKIQMVLESRTVEPEATYSLQALGIAFGRVFIENTTDYDWWMVEDEYGRDPAIRFKRTTLLAFPLTMISKRVEDGEEIDVRALYDGLQEQLDDIRAQNYSDA
jgi:hypothetical protein